MSLSKQSLYPEIQSTNPDANSPFSHASSSSSMYPSLDPTTTEQPLEHVLVTVPGVILHLIEKDSSVHLASGDLTITSFKEGERAVTVLASVGNQVQWPLAKDVSAVKLDDSHYFFTIRVPQEGGESEVLNYGVTLPAEGKGKLDEVLEKYCYLSVEKVEGLGNWEVLKSGKEKGVAVEESSAAYWTTLAPNVEDYSSRFARWIASGSGQMVRGILWCGDVTVDRLKWGNDFLKKRLQPGHKTSQISPQAMERMKRFTSKFQSSFV